MQTSTFSKGDAVGIVAQTVDQNSAPIPGSQVFMELRDANDNLLTSLKGFSGTAGMQS